MKMNKCFCMVAVSVICLCASAYALTEAWHVSLHTNGRFREDIGWQVIPDGTGGVACNYYFGTGDTNVVQWFNAKGHQIYSGMQLNPNSLKIIGLDKSHLVYNINDTKDCVVVDKLGRETHVANSQIMTGRDFQPLQNDKNGFFIIRYTGDGSDGELVRFVYR